MKCFPKVVDWNVILKGIIGAVDVLVTNYSIIQIILKFIHVVPFDLKSLRFNYTAIGSDNGFGLDNGLVPTRRQAIIWTNADLIHWRIYAAQQGDELIVANLAYFIYITSFPRGNGVIEASGLIYIFRKINTAVGRKYERMKTYRYKNA